MQKYNWQIVDRRYIEVVPNERENAWKDLLIMTLLRTPQTYRKGIRKGFLEHFDFKQPIYYDLKQKRIGALTRDVLSMLNPPSEPKFDSRLISPVYVVIGFILVLLSYLVLEGRFI